MQEYARYPPTLKKVYWREQKKEGSKFSTAQHSTKKLTNHLESIRKQRGAQATHCLLCAYRNTKF